MMSQLDSRFRNTHAASGLDLNPANQRPSTKAHVRRKTKSEDLNILAHAQAQFQDHLGPTFTQSSDSTWQPQTQAWSQTQLHPYSQSQPQHDQYPRNFQHSTAPRPRSSHQFSTATHSDLRTPVTHPPFRWWENGVLVSNSESEEEDVRPSIEPADDMSIVQSIEDEASVSPGTKELGDLGAGEGKDEVKMEDVSGEEAEKMRFLGEAQKHWNGYVKHKESWVRRAGLKREREENERHGAAKTSSKRGRAGV